MSPALRLAVLAAATGVLFTGIAAVAAALVYPRVRERLGRRPPGSRARLLTAWAALPGSAALGSLALCFVPSLWPRLGLAVDHCPLHDGHLHLCFAHAPLHPATPGEWAILLVGALAIVAVLSRVVRGHVRTYRAVAAMVSGVPRSGSGLLEVRAPVSITVGLGTPRVLVSTGLRERLPAPLFQAVLAHEHAHARRRDPLRLLAVALLGALHLPATRRLLLADIALACEQAADEQAAREVGDRTVVAEAIVAVERLLRGQPSIAGALGMAGCAAEARVTALLDEPLEAPRPRRARWLLRAALGGAALAAASPIHHLTETLLDLIAG